MMSRILDLKNQLIKNNPITMMIDFMILDLSSSRCSLMGNLFSLSFSSSVGSGIFKSSPVNRDL